MTVKNLDRTIGEGLINLTSIALVFLAILLAIHNDPDFLNIMTKLIGLFYLSIIAYRLSQIEEKKNEEGARNEKK
jgi:threonine/homoserine/homoserine lactone efflux protein